MPYGYGYPRRARRRDAAFDEILVVAGQSNAVTSGISGASGLPDGWADTERVRIWNHGAGAFATYGPASAANWGPEAAYAKAWLDDAANAGRTLHIVKHAVSGSQLGDTSIYGQHGTSATDWSQSSGEAYPALVARVDAARAALARPRVTAVLWLAGEADSKDATTTADYAANAAELYAAMRADFGTASTAIVAATITDLLTGEGMDFRGILEQQLAVAALDPHNHLVDLRGRDYQEDDVHMSPATASVLGAGAYALARGGGTEAQWWDPRAIVDLDYEHDRFFRAATEYGSIAAMVSAGFYTQPATHGDEVDLTGLLPAEFTVTFEGVNAVTEMPSQEWPLSMDDHPSGDEFFPGLIWLNRNTFSGVPKLTIGMFAGSLAQNSASTMAITAGAGAGSAMRMAARIKTNDLKFAVNGTSSAADANCTVPTLTRLVVGDSGYDGGTGQPYGGTVKRVQILNAALSDARLKAKTAFLP